MKKVTIAIIGMGTRGLTLFESILRLASVNKFGINIYVCDPGNFGEGVHSSDQPKYLLLNTPAGLISIYPVSDVGGDNGKGVTLSEWARNKRYKIDESGLVSKTSTDGRSIHDADFLPRWLLGEYLSDYFNQLLDSVPSHVNVKKINSMISSVSHNDSCFFIEPKNSEVFRSDFVFMCTGHGIISNFTSEEESTTNANLYLNSISKDEAVLFEHPYPVQKLSSIQSGSSVVIQGMGLAAHDTIANLTLGRGGYHVEEDGILEYKPSGFEPKIYMYSRSSVPYRARSIHSNDKLLSSAPVFLSTEDIVQLSNHAKTGVGLSYLVDVHSKLLLEMAYRYESTKLGYPISKDEFDCDKDVLSYMQQLLSNDDLSKTNSLTNYQTKAYDFIQDDIDEALLGESKSAIKSALESIRYCRAAYRLLLEKNILSGQEHHTFLTKYLPEMQRSIYGPPIRRNQELLSLIRSGVVELLGGGDVKMESKEGGIYVKICFESQDVLISKIDYIINAHCPSSQSVISNDESVYKELIKQSVLKPFIKDDVFIGGIDVNYLYKAISANSSMRRIWVLGYPTEGSNFFTYALPHTYIYSRHQQDADLCAAEFFSILTASYL
ncbi:FAD/NAD(P)-binding protein [Pantoea agglomerans]|uniref:FAD/NAD(P)-binding protein n=1 Tax=Enterobacter agglomerans TaxID=549 RepID=UPI00090733E5|nr:FAD/NAD(P)-binding protein [Pantoea agglomerans]